LVFGVNKDGEPNIFVFVFCVIVGLTIGVVPNDGKLLLIIEELELGNIKFVLFVEGLPKAKGFEGVGVAVVAEVLKKLNPVTVGNPVVAVIGVVVVVTAGVAPKFNKSSKPLFVAGFVNVEVDEVVDGVLDPIPNKSISGSGAGAGAGTGAGFGAGAGVEEDEVGVLPPGPHRPLTLFTLKFVGAVVVAVLDEFVFEVDDDVDEGVLVLVVVDDELT